jgi:hypothetical protein
MASEMNDCPWERIEVFSSHSEFVRFCDWMNNCIIANSAERVPVLHRYQGIESFTEEWFEHVDSRKQWRLVHPDGPFHGLFEPIVP